MCLFSIAIIFPNKHIGLYIQVSTLLPSESRVMSSKQAPLFITFRSSDGDIAPQPKVRVLFKQGDDLRQDFLTLQALQHMQVI